ncbi:RecQ family ATP-dependent DNA helicase [Neobacillus drentensis]|uniref:RecQ family ATP-dependent DNA helicase n=1 Tax=Neobacillus drentensis TaxID=220684 RepID=UPI002FFFA7A6
MKELLATYFPSIPTLHNYQEEVISKIMQRVNSLCIVPTGGGKSLVYQLAALKLTGTTIVISPLKALMEEQVIELRDKNIEAISLNSDLSFEEQRKIMRNLKKTKPKLIYVSPERLFNYFFRSALISSGLDISLVAIDEAHCISQWGIDFCPDYGNIRPFIECLLENGHTPTILALTATLGLKAREDIKQEFDIRFENINNNIIRDNLELNFKEVHSEEEKWDTMLDFITEKNLSKVLVYLYSRPKCEELAAELEGSDFFHAGLSLEEKNRVLRDFKAGKIKVLFSTTAFGMGINIPDIDGVIHYQIPESVEEYYQHVGRGGRDKKLCPVCHCLFLWSETNFDRKARRIRSNTLTKEDIDKGFDHLALKKKAGKKTYVKWEVIYNNDGSYGSANLSLVRSMFEKHGVCESVGDVFGSPTSIILKKDTPLWSEMLKKIYPRNQFLIAEKRTGISLGRLIDHIYEQELKGNIKTLPATERTLFLRGFYDQLPDQKYEEIINESLEVQTFKLDRLGELKTLCLVGDKFTYIAQILDVPYGKNK